MKIKVEMANADASEKENVLIKEVGSCMVRIRFSEKPNPEVEKAVLYSLIDVFENRVKASDVNTELYLI